MCEKSNLLLRALFAAPLLLTTACYDPGMQTRVEAGRQARLAASIPKEQAQINGISLYSDAESGLRHTFGQPQKITTGISELVGGPTKTIEFRDAKAHLINDELYNLTCFGQSCRSQTEVRIGDGFERVIALHQKGELEPRENGVYFLRYPLADADIELIFKIRNGRVFQMELWADYS